MKGLAIRAAEGGLLFMLSSMLSAVIAVVVMTVIYSRTTGNAPPLTNATEIKVTPREVGLNFDVLKFCNDPTTKVAGVAMTDAPLGGTRYIASRAQESVNWPDSPPGENPNATHYWPATDGDLRTDGTRAVPGEQLSSTAEVTKPAADCLKRKATPR